MYMYMYIYTHVCMCRLMFECCKPLSGSLTSRTKLQNPKQLKEQTHFVNGISPPPPSHIQKYRLAKRNLPGSTFHFETEAAANLGDGRKGAGAGYS